MRTYKFWTLVSLFAVSTSFAQDYDTAKKAIDAEQFEKAKLQLKQILKSKPEDGQATFLLGNIYLKQEIEDSASYYFQKGITLPSNAHLNYIGLGQLNLNKNKADEAVTNFNLSTKDLRKKDYNEFLYIANAYMAADKPDYNLALSYVNKALLVNPNSANVKLVQGDAYYGLKNQNEAYTAYRSAFSLDPSLLRAKMQLGVLLKGAKAYKEAVAAYNEVITLNANYGPVYRELAETYYYWANNEPKNYTTHIKTALGHYEKYLSLTDYSLSSRMRHADFLILAKDYKALELEALEMKKLDKVNPRILRYLGYSAYENGNLDIAQSSLEEFVNNPKNKIIGRDYLYLALIKVKKSAINTPINTVLFEEGYTIALKASEMDNFVNSDWSTVAKEFYDKKMYKEASKLYGLAIKNTASRSFLLDNYFYGTSIYFSCKDLTQQDIPLLQSGESALNKLIELAPKTQDAYLYKARLNRLMDNDEVMSKSYEDYVSIVNEKGAEEATKSKAKIIEAYSSIASHYANFDKPKAIEYLKKTLEIDPTNKYALDALKALE